MNLAHTHTHTHTHTAEEVSFKEIEIISYKGLKVKNRYQLKEKEINLDVSENFITVLKKKNKKFQQKGTELSDELLFEESLESAERVLPYFPYEDDGVNLEMI